MMLIDIIEFGPEIRVNIRQIRNLCLTAVWPGVGKVAGSQATKVANTVA